MQLSNQLGDVHVAAAGAGSLELLAISHPAMRNGQRDQTGLNLSCIFYVYYRNHDSV